MPQISDLLAHLFEANYYSALDCTEGFRQIPIAIEDRPKTSSITAKGKYQFIRCPFGFTNAPAVYQRAMKEVFRDGLYKRCVIYIGDILVDGKTRQVVLDDLAWVFQRCREANVKLKRSKCSFLQTAVEFLGYKIEGHTILTIRKKCDKWMDQIPTSRKEAQAVLGFLNYYSRFIENFSAKTAEIRAAIKKDPFIWTTGCRDVSASLLEELRHTECQ